jgi:hypothetical protein
MDQSKVTLLQVVALVASGLNKSLATMGLDGKKPLDFGSWFSPIESEPGQWTLTAYPNAEFITQLHVEPATAYAARVSNPSTEKYLYVRPQDWHMLNYVNDLRKLAFDV